MTRIITGPRISKQGEVRLACSATIFDEKREKVLLTRRADNGQWCLPGGHIDPGETVSEGCQREVWEETGLRVRVVRLTGVYSNPDELLVYPDAKAHIFSLNFEVDVTGGEAGLSSETTSLEWVPVEQAVNMPLFHSHAERIRDALTGLEAAFLR